RCALAPRDLQARDAERAALGAGHECGRRRDAARLDLLRTQDAMLAASIGLRRLDEMVEPHAALEALGVLEAKCVGGRDCRRRDQHDVDQPFPHAADMSASGMPGDTHEITPRWRDVTSGPVVSPETPLSTGGSHRCEAVYGCHRYPRTRFAIVSHLMATPPPIATLPASRPAGSGRA